MVSLEISENTLPILFYLIPSKQTNLTYWRGEGEERERERERERRREGEEKKIHQAMFTYVFLYV